MTSPNAKYGLLARGVRRDLSEKGWVPVRYWVIWWWALGGLVAGIVLTATVVRFVPSVRRQLISRDDSDEPVRMVELPS